MKYLFLLLIFHYTRQIEGMLINKIIHFGDTLTFTFLMFFGEFLGGIAVIFYQRLFFRKKNKVKINIKEETSSISVKLIHGQKEKFQMSMADKLYKIILLIFFISFFDFTEFIISWNLPQIAIISPTSDQRLRIIITIISSLLCTYALRLKTGKHHNFSLIGMSSCSVIILILELIYKSKGNNIGNFILAFILVICRLAFVSLCDVTERYLVEFNFVNMFKILSAEGFFGIILCIIFSLITKKNPLNEINKVYKELDAGESFLLIFFLVLYFILSAGVNIYKIICNVIYTPMAKSLPAYFLNPLFIIYYFIWEKDFTNGNERDYFYFFVNLILSIIIDFFALIYNEFFILKCFSLDQGTHYGISKRAELNSILELGEIEESPLQDDSF